MNSYYFFIQLFLFAFVFFFKKRVKKYIVMLFMMARRIRLRKSLKNVSNKEPLKNQYIYNGNSSDEEMPPSPTLKND